jgi:cullin-associated NEDD8-dissociated protein 1
MLQPVEIEALQDSVVGLLEKDKGNSVVKKRAVVAVSMLAHYLLDDMLSIFMNRAITVLRQPKLSSVTRRLYITILGSMARSIPHRFGRYLPSVVPFVMQALSDEELQEQLEEINEGSGDSGLEFNEIREAALVALDAFLASCPTQMRPFTDEAISSCLRYLKFDPNYAMDEDEEMEDEEDDDIDGFEDDDEFEADAGFDDDDDASWKVRRCAAKALYTLISTRSSGDLLDNGVLYTQAAPALVKRFDEREENVRLEVLSALSLLVRKTGEGIIPEFSIDNFQSEYLNQLPQSRKRRRQSSGGAASSFTMTSASGFSGTGLTSPILEKAPASGPRADLSKLTPSIVKGATKLLKGKLIPTKQATINLLDDMVVVQRGGLAEYFDQIIGPIIEAIRSSSASTSSAALSVTGGNASATPSTLRMAALRLTSDIAKHHSSTVLQPHLTSLVAGVVTVVQDRFYKISGEAIQTAEEVVKAITPPRSQKSAQKYKTELQKLYDVIVERASASDADAEVRNKAIHALGILLSRTSGTEGSSLLSAEKRKAGLDQLASRLKGETTRLAAVRAIDTVAALSSGSIELDAEWIRGVTTELAAQLRKANRGLRGSSVQALRHLVLSPAAQGALDNSTTEAIVTSLIPGIVNNDAQLLGPGLLVIAHLALEKPKIVVTSELISALCKLLQSNVAGSVLDSLLVLVTNIGQIGSGQPLMAGLLKDVGVSGDPSVVGKVIGTLLVASGGSAGVTMDSFVQEIKTNSQDQSRASLALAVLGEAGLRLGPKFQLPPSIFLNQFNSDLDKVAVSAAVALGRAGAGNIPAYLPVILKQLQTPGTTQYLLLQSVKEILQQAALSSTDISDFSDAVWEQLLGAANVEDNKAVCAECIGRIVIIDPSTYIPKLEVSSPSYPVSLIL